MRTLSVPLEDVRDLFATQAWQFVDACRGLTELELLDPSRCRGWSRLDLLVHVRGGLEEMAATAGVHADVEPDTDAASYWGAHADGREDDPVPHILWARRTAAAYARPDGALRHLQDVTARAAAAVTGVPDRPVHFQGTVMTMGDFVATWVVELAIHQLDLDVVGEPAGAALARRTIEAVADADLPLELGDSGAVLLGLGRIPWPGDATQPGRFPVSL